MVINSKPAWAPRWHFNTMPLHDKAFKTKHLMFRSTNGLCWNK